MQKFRYEQLGKTLTLISGPCVIESEERALFSAEYLKQVASDIGIPLIYKSSFDKANRSSLDSYRGPGLDQGLSILERVKKEFDLPIVTDVHTPRQAEAAALVCDVLQIPAFLCRQTDLIIAAAHTGRIVKVKKGQFMAPWDMSNVVEKIRASGNEKILLTDRGTSFGYNNLVCDMRSIPIMKKLGYPVCFDATHAVQLPGGEGKTTGGQREFVITLAKCAIAAGADAIFIEAHPCPDEAMSDKACQVPLEEMKELLIELKELYDVVNRKREAAHV